MDVVADPAALLPLVAAREPLYLERLAELVGIDSGSQDVAGVNRVVDRCEQWLRDDGYLVERHRGKGTGDALVARIVGGLPREAGGRRVLLLGHLDTVFPSGTAAQRPFRTEGGRAYGPGVCDDKGGVLAGLTAVQALADAGHTAFGEVVVHLAPDEEIGSPFSRALITALAQDADVALCLEGAREDGSLVSARKGMVDLVVEVTGRAAHAGIEPERGINAVLEAAHQVIALQALNGSWPGVTCNVGVVAAGTRPNVVADRAVLSVEVRATARAHLAAALATVDEIASSPTVPGATTLVRRGEAHVPMERTPATAALATTSAEIAAKLGFAVRDVATGGAADANTVAALGVPVLDGLGPVGGNDHSPAEFLDLDSVVPRTALLAGLIARAGRGAD